MTNPIKISLAFKDFDIPSLRLDTWVTEAIKESTLAKQVLNKNNFSLSRNRIKNLIE
ncbi:MAG: RNA pseudouridine synthase, partial [Alphaproteobacteria bacterium]|nr:RNA pseudouridine synthase [Alphaproteobacteria bacterium]